MHRTELSFNAPDDTDLVLQFMVLEMWEFGYNLREMKDRQALYSEMISEYRVWFLKSENDFWAPDGLRNHFLSIGLDDLSSLLSYIQALTFLKS